MPSDSPAGSALHPRVRLSCVSWIILSVFVFEAQWTDGGYLRDILARLCPVEVPRVAGQNDNTAGGIRLHFVAVELIAEANVEHTGHDRVDTVLGVSVRH